MKTLFFKKSKTEKKTESAARTKKYLVVAIIQRNPTKTNHSS